MALSIASCAPLPPTRRALLQASSVKGNESAVPLLKGRLLQAGSSNNGTDFGGMLDIAGPSGFLTKEENFYC